MADLFNLEDRFLSPRQAAELIGVCVQTVRNWADDGTIKAFRLPSGLLRFRLSDLLALTEADASEWAKEHKKGKKPALNRKALENQVLD
jgi:excisionase family DNA binding protein